jgi:hypothetical protein
VSNTEFRRFHNAIRILINLGMRDMEQAGVIDVGDYEDWTRFLKNPHLYFVQISEARAERLWALIEKHQPADLRRSNLHPVMAQVLAPFVDDPK